MSKACFSGSSSDAFPSAALIPPSAAPEWLRVGWSFETSATSAPASKSLDRGAHAGAAGADDEYVVLRLHRSLTLPNAVGSAPLRRGASVGERGGPSALDAPRWHVAEACEDVAKLLTTARRQASSGSPLDRHPSSISPGP